jgi:prepilin peptidase CpaA
MSMPAIHLWAIAGIVTVCAVIDLRIQKIPNRITFPAMLAALVFHGVVGGWSGLGDSALGMALGLFLFSIPFLMNGMGGGDAKLLGAVGAWVGPAGLWPVVLYTALAGGVYAIALIAFHRECRERFYYGPFQQFKHFLLTRSFLPLGSEPVKTTGPKLCYGLAIAAGTFTHILLSGNFIHLSA